jgi:ABC-type multidrug transport system ATPase subunit
MIRLDLVTKEYRGNLPFRSPVRALDGLTLSVAPGTSLGVIGLNGAGKSTLLRLLLGYVRPTRGTATIDGLDPRAYAQRHGIGYVPERVAIPRGWSVRRALTAFAMLANLGDDADQRIARAAERLGLDELASRRVGTLSKGNLQRLAIAQTLLGDRELLVLDEPTDGLDPVWIVALRSIVAEWRAGNPRRIAIIASHNLAEVERLCDRVVVLHHGRARCEFDPRRNTPLEDEFLRLVAGWESAA